MADPNAFPDFVWSIGEEGSDPIVMRQGERYRQDQFAASGHYDHMEAVLAAIADLGVQVVRYGTPWRLAEPSPGEYDWTLWDRAFAACDAAGLEPVVEFLHFGLPDHFDGFLDGAWVDGFITYVDAFLARYREPRWFTPVNEPGITARLSARFGGQLDMDQARALGIPEQVLNGMISRALFDRKAAALGMLVTDDQIRRLIGHQDVFKNDLGHKSNAHPPEGYKEITVHFVYAVKHDGHYK